MNNRPKARKKYATEKLPQRNHLSSDGSSKLTEQIAVLENELARCRSSQQEAIKSREQIITILESISDAFYAIDNQWCFTYINKEAAKFINGKHQELLGKNILEAFPTLIGSEVEKNFRQAMSEQVPIHFETPSNVFPGVWFAMHLYPTKEGLSVYFQDITEHQRIQQQLFEAQKLEAIGQLAGGIAHDLNNQMTIIMGYADLRLSKLTPESPVYNDFMHIKKAVEKSVNLTRQLLMFSRRHPLKKEILNLNSRLQEYQIMLEQLVGGSIRLTYNLTPDLWMIHADTTNIDQIITNLAINARDSIPERGSITFITENRVIKGTDMPKNGIPPGQYVVLTVKDTGAGIDEQLISHIFEPFFTTKGQAKGTGLGLSVVYGIVKAHDGWIHVQSEIGKGSQFEIHFPAILDAIDSVPVAHNNTPLPFKQYHGNNERILLVEDELEVMEIMETILSKYGFIVFPCHSVSEAFHVFNREAGCFDLVLSDIILPDGRGTDFVIQLLKKAPSLKVLLVSGYSDDRINLEYIRKQGLPFLSKPYTVEEMLRQIHEILH